MFTVQADNSVSGWNGGVNHEAKNRDRLRTGALPDVQRQFNANHVIMDDNLAISNAEAAWMDTGR